MILFAIILVIIALAILSPDMLGSLVNLLGDGINGVIALFQPNKKEVKKAPLVVIEQKPLAWTKKK
jgi:hypothetical protein